MVGKQPTDSSVGSSLEVPALEALLFKKRNHNSVDVLFVPKQKADRMDGEDRSWGGGRPPPLRSLLLHWFLNRIPSPPLVIAKRQGSHTSLFGIHLNEILDEQKGLTASKRDWIEEEMY
ncbi:unnamed protein product [Rangifer tarandus platyrhynchus]|uniref:Uncharacterized protein n=1 Tax=Rangifer tarandus platyrhynchus TaxID=3082113 RepID=A0AC59Z2S4_RANTA